MEIPSNLGRHCTLASCNELDFLPIECIHCRQNYCKNHIFPDYHKCLASLTRTVSLPSASTAQLERCTFGKRTKPSLESYISHRSENTDRSPALCLQCKKSYCVEHRHPSSHGCLPEQSAAATPKNEAARVLLAKHFPSANPSTASSSSAASKPKTSDPRKLAQLRKVELMKMRHRALPADPKDRSKSVAIDQRIHLQVNMENDTSTTKVFWFHKTLIAGKALDHLASHFGLSPPIKLRLADSEEQLLLQYDKPLSQQVVDGSSGVIVWDPEQNA